MLRLLLIDGNNLFWRSYHAIKNRNHTARDGSPAWAIRGAVSTVVEHIARWSPSHLLVAFDAGPSRYRRSLYPQYKIRRSSHQHDDGQEEKFKLVLRVLGVPTWSEPGVEADDIIATCVRRWKDAPDIVIVSNDKDLRQLVDWNVVVVQPRRGDAKEVIWTKAKVNEKYGVSPDRLPELFALVGDDNDNVAGVPNVGYKRAATLLQKYGGLGDVLCSDDPLVRGYERQVLLAYRLVVLDGSVARCAFGEDYIRWLPEPGDSDYLDFLGLGSIAARWQTGDLWRRETRPRYRRLRRG